MLTVEWETQGVHMKRGFSWLVLWACSAGTRDFFPALRTCSNWLSIKIKFSSLYTISFRMSPLPSKLGIQSCHVAYLWSCLFLTPRPLKKGFSASPRRLRMFLLQILASWNLMEVEEMKTKSLRRLYPITGEILCSRKSYRYCFSSEITK